jgi:cell division protein FtsW
VLLIVVLLVNWGQPVKRWINLGLFDLQPSEYAKLAFFIYLSSWLNKMKNINGTLKQKLIYHLNHELLPFLIMLGSLVFLIVIQPDLDTTITIGATSFVVYFIAGKNKMHLFSSLFLAFIFIVLIYIGTQTAAYRLVRIENWWQFIQTGIIQDPFWRGFQLRQVLIAVASGEVFGMGFGESRQKFHYLGDTAFSDTIFAIFAEEFGLVGSVVLIALFVYFLLMGYKTAKKSSDFFGFLLAISITTWFAFQIFFHIASNVALIPINGNTLPFFSYGGSSTIVNLTAVGILFNINKQGKKD